MMDRLKKIGLALVVACLTLSFQGCFKKLIYSTEELTNKADIIVECEVTSVTRRFFSQNIATLKPLTYLKGDNSAKVLRIQYGNDIFNNKNDRNRFKVGHQYILFLRSDEPTLRMLGDPQGWFPVLDNDLVWLGDRKIPKKQFISEITGQD